MAKVQIGVGVSRHYKDNIDVKYYIKSKARALKLDLGIFAEKFQQCFKR